MDTALIERVCSNPLQFPIVFKTVRRFPYASFFVNEGESGQSSHVFTAAVIQCMGKSELALSGFILPLWRDEQLAQSLNLNFLVVRRLFRYLSSRARGPPQTRGPPRGNHILT